MFRQNPEILFAFSHLSTSATKAKKSPSLFVPYHTGSSAFSKLSKRVLIPECLMDPDTKQRRFRAHPHKATECPCQFSHWKHPLNCACGVLLQTEMHICSELITRTVSRFKDQVCFAAHSQQRCQELQQKRYNVQKDFHSDKLHNSTDTWKFPSSQGSEHHDQTRGQETTIPNSFHQISFTNKLLKDHTRVTAESYSSSLLKKQCWKTTGN